tara:strand:- start:3104 stop:3460 length:357 start_codon:yes stop_codon:yes gene_type:complete
MSNIERGQIWLVNLDPTIGHEIKKIRPCVIVQNNIGNKYSSLTIIAPITSRDLDNLYPVNVFLDKNEKGIEMDSKVLLNQIRSVDKIRLIKKLGNVSVDKMLEIDEALRISLGFESFA